MTAKASLDRTVGRQSQPWTVLLATFWIVTLIEAIGVSQVIAFMPLYLTDLGLPKPSIPHWVGVLNALVFVFGLPMVPLWGVWADKYSRKAVIVRSALVEALVFGLVALSREPWQLAGSFLFIGFQLGNTGVMLAALRERTPPGRLGTAFGIFGVASPLGFAAGPALGGFMVDGLHTSLPLVYAVSAALSVAAAALITFGFREVRPEQVPTGKVINLAYGAIRSVLTEPATRRLFVLFGMMMLARQMISPFVPLLVEKVNQNAVGLASAVALVLGIAALVGGFISPLGGAIGDRVGFRPVLAITMVGAGLALGLMPLAPSVTGLAAVNLVFAAFASGVSAMVFGLLAVEVPAERRSTTLNLVFLPLYIAGIIGPAIGALIVSAGVPVVFVMSAVILLIGGALVVSQQRTDLGGESGTPRRA